MLSKFAPHRMGSLFEAGVAKAGFCCLPRRIPIVFVEKFMRKENCKAICIRIIAWDKHFLC
jgi:hypothetical protein